MVEHKCLSPWKGAVAGGLIAFAWSSISWMALPFHEKTLKPLPDAAAVIQGVGGEKAASGVYVLMNDPKGQKGPTDPFVFVNYAAKGAGAMGGPMLLALLLQMVGGFYWTWILGKIPGLTLKDAAVYGLMFSVCVGVLGVMPSWVWWKFPLGYCLLYVLDLVIPWTASSVVIAKWCQAAVCELPPPKA